MTDSDDFPTVSWQYQLPSHKLSNAVRSLGRLVLLLGLTIWAAGKALREVGR